MDVRQQIDAGIIVCPATGRRLSRKTDDGLVTDDGSREYALLRGTVPVLLENPGYMEEYSRESETMNREYGNRSSENAGGFLSKIRSISRRDFRSKRCRDDWRDIVGRVGPESVCLSVGGGPGRVHPGFTNLNIGPFPNVDLVSDAHALPYADDSVDIVHSEAVFEHLHDPARAAAEIHRVLKPGAVGYICTPFLQAFHGYPHHYQNFTLTGHKALFESAGLEVLSSGTCVGPMFTITNLISVFIVQHVPRPIRLPCLAVWTLFSLTARPLDLYLNAKPNSYVLASSTYAIVRKRAKQDE